MALIDLPDDIIVDPSVTLVELLFFGYRDFVGEADRVLARYGFGRAHHRVLHFVNQRPELSVAELLTILEITKQSLARVLRELVEAGCIVQRTGISDRRQRLLVLTDHGQNLANELLSLQTARIQAALGDLPAEHHRVIRSFLFGLIEPARQPEIAARLRIRTEERP